MNLFLFLLLISTYPQGKFVSIARYQIIRLKPVKQKVQSSSGKTWQDKDTNLIWQVKIDHDKQDLSWSDAKEYCSTLSLDTQDDWRLPNKKELHSIRTKESYENSKSGSKKTYIKKPLLKSMDMQWQIFWS